MSKKNREIKFRAWNGERMLMGLSLVKLLNIFEWGDTATTDTDNVEGTGWDESQRAETLMWLQFTGRKDKNGKEIYESDILAWLDWNYNTDKNSIEEALENPDHHYRLHKGTVEWVNGGYDFEKSPEYCKVIGNIYENPELLNEKKNNTGIK